MKELNQTLTDLLDEFDRLEAESTRVSDRVRERETPRPPEPETADGAESSESSEIEQLYSDPQVIDFWKSEGKRYDYLYWVRAMIHRHIEPARVDIAPSTVTTGAALDVQRRDAYRRLAELLENPTEKLARELTDGSLVAALRGLDLVMAGHELLEAGLTALEGFRGQKAGELIWELRKEYARIIYDSFFPYVSPYESIYQGDRQVQGERTGQVYSAFRDAGLKAGGELADHIMHECEFAATLLDRILDARASGDAAQADTQATRLDTFLRDHLLQWATKFGHDFHKVATMREENSRDRPAQAYGVGIGQLVRGFFTLEIQRLHHQTPFPEQRIRFAAADAEGRD